MTYMKKFFFAAMVFLFSLPVYAQNTSVVSNENELKVAMDNPLVDHIIADNSFTFNFDLNVSSGRNVNIDVEKSSTVIDGNGYSGFSLINSSFSITGSTYSVLTAFGSASSGSVVNLTNSSATFKTLNFSTNSALNGGVFYSSNSKFMIFDSSFTANVSSGNGGALYFDYYSTSTLEGITAASNTATDFGGFIYAQQSTFSVTNSSFTFNNADYGGAVSVSTSEFTLDSLWFSSNTALTSGGALYVDKGSFTVINSTFMGNEAVSGAAGYFTEVSSGYINNVYVASNTASNGAGFYADKTKEMLFQNVSFASNTASQSGAALYMSQSTGTRVNSVLFTSNTAQDKGGALYAEHSAADFDSVAAFGNKADAGGAFYITNSSMSFYGSGFNNNIAASSAGAVYIESSTLLSQNSVFTNNKASSNGGAVVASEGSVLTVRDGEFSKNSAASSGGALYLDKAKADFRGVSFNENTSDKGGAVFIDGGKMSVNGGTFSRNKASTAGGAFYLQGDSSNKAELTLTAEASAINFNSNTANGKANDIYLGDNSKLTLNARNYDISLNGGIAHSSAPVNISIIKTGSKDLILGGNNTFGCDFSIAQGGFSIADSAILSMNNLNIVSGSSFKAKRNAQINISDVLDVAQGGYIATESVKSFYAQKLNMYGTMQVGVDLKNGVSDKITADEVNLSSASSVLLLGGNLGSGSGDFTIIESTAISGKFKFSDGAYGARTTWNINESSKNVTLHVLTIGYGQLADLTYSQQQVADLIDKEYDNIYAAGGDMWDSVISPMDAMDKKDAVETLGMLAGSFYADLFKIAAVSNQRASLFEQIRIRENTNENSWIHAFGSMINYKQDEYSLGDLEDINFGVNAGWDLANSEKLVGGIMLGYENHNVKQYEDKAIINSFKAGFYGAWLLESFELKSILSLGYQSYDVTREIRTLGKKAEGEFNGYTASFDAQMGYKIWLSDYLNIKPFMALGAAGSVNEKVEEKGGAYGLKIESQNYIRSNALLGLGFEGDYDTVAWYINAGAGSLITGAQNEIETEFIGSKGKMTIKGVEEGEIIINAACGVDFSVHEDISIYVNGGYASASGFENIFANLGLRYKLSY